jgi:pimeloyl-ACP methyl ester carboxylesterase
MHLLSYDLRFLAMTTGLCVRALHSAACALIAIVASADPTSADPMLADFAYPYPVAQHGFRAQEMDLTMAYMDIAAPKPNGQTVVLLHGKNFCGATWEGVIQAITDAGYRAVIPDQIGFCKSDKPRDYTYGLHELAANTQGLLRKLGIAQPILIGHSMGGMLAIRMAMSFPDQVGGLILLNPIGLEDWRAKGVPERTLDELFATERTTDAARIKAYQQKVYYDGRWTPAYDRWVGMLASMYSGPDGDTVAWAQAKTSRMVFSDPVIHELERIQAPVALLIGGKDTTAIGRDRVGPEIAATLGRYPELARGASARFKNLSDLQIWPDLGHSPHIEAPGRVHAHIVETLRSMHRLRGAQGNRP